MVKKMSKTNEELLQSLTPRQQEILDLIIESMRETGMPPTRADICDAFGFRSPTAADDHLKALDRKGVIELVPGQARGIRVLVGPEGGIPLIGRVAAGAPILAQQHVEEYFDLDPTFFRPYADYLLKVRGHSMRDGGILNGDFLAVHSVRTAYTGQVIVARLEDEVTVKRFRRKGNKVILEAQNPDFAPIHVDLRDEDFTIEGLGVGVIRNRKL